MEVIGEHYLLTVLYESTYGTLLLLYDGMVYGGRAGAQKGTVLETHGDKDNEPRPSPSPCPASLILLFLFIFFI
jgi:hypothetical protein